MSRSSARDAQIEPTAALAAVFAVVVGLALYAGALDRSMPGTADRNVAATALERVHDALTRHGQVVDVDLLGEAATAGPDGYRTNVTVRTTDECWSVGPPVPEAGPDVDRAVRAASVRRAPARVDAGTLRVVVWP